MKKRKLLFEIIKTRKDETGNINGYAIKVNSKKTKYDGKYLNHDCITRTNETRFAGIWPTNVAAHKFIVKNWNKLHEKFRGK
jgi:hypothetical protein